VHERPLGELSRALAAGEVSSVELTRRLLERIATLDSRVNSFVTVCEAGALAAAQAADRRRARGEAGPLTGVPVAHKDVFCTAGVRTTCGSRMLADFVPPYSATIVERLQAAGMVLLGKTNMDEFAMGSSSETSFFGPVRNPWRLDRVPGGSSGGSAAAVAARLTPIATGTDTGGSIRQPAAFCGLTGLKPTYGRVSRWGLVAFASSLDQAGVLAPSAADAAPVLQAMAGFDPRDSTSAGRPGEDYGAALARPLEGLRVGVLREEHADGVEVGVRAAVDRAFGALEGLGARVHPISLPHADLAIAAYYVIAPAEASSNLARYDGVRYGYRASEPADLEDLYKRTRAEGFGAEVKRRIMIGTYALSAGYYDAYYLKAQKIRRLVSGDFKRAFAEVDVIAGPAAPTIAFPLGERLDDPVAMYLSDVFTAPASLAGLPAISLPVGFADDLPVGLQLIGDYFSEGRLLNVAHRYQLATDWHTRIPPGFE